MMFPGDIDNVFKILVRAWFETIFSVDKDEYEDFRITHGCSGQLMVHAWLIPANRGNRGEIWIGQSQEIMEELPGEFKVAYVTFEPRELNLSIDVRTKNDKTEYSMSFAPDHQRDKWDKITGNGPKEEIKQIGKAINIPYQGKENAFIFHACEVDL